MARNLVLLWHWDEQRDVRVVADSAPLESFLALVEKPFAARINSLNYGLNAGRRSTIA